MQMLMLMLMLMLSEMAFSPNNPPCGKPITGKRTPH